MYPTNLNHFQYFAFNYRSGSSVSFLLYTQEDWSLYASTYTKARCELLYAGNQNMGQRLTDPKCAVTSEPRQNGEAQLQ